MGAITVGSLEELIVEVRRDYAVWSTPIVPWFRGEPLTTTTPLLPVLFRDPSYDEISLLQQFRARAPALGLGSMPPRAHTDEWLFLARHVGLPTRLLDWTEGLLIGLLFAVHDSYGQPRKEVDGATVWMLDPIELNRLSETFGPSPGHSYLPLTWLNHPTDVPTREDLLLWLRDTMDPKIEDKAAHLQRMLNNIPSNLGALNIRRAWSHPRTDGIGLPLPVAVHGTTVHQRISAQKGCFTVHGIREEPLPNMVAERVLKQYIIANPALTQVRRDLRLVGVTYSTVFPDLDGLAIDLKSGL